MRKPLSSHFFQQQTIDIAPKLLGMLLTTRIRGVTTGGRIVEVEAYHQDGDRASHSWSGVRPRNRAMFLPGGHCYVYLIYGMHYCVNVVTETAGIGAAVLIRAIEPLVGIETMRRRRACPSPRELTNGPAKVCQALGISRSCDGADLLSSPRIRLEPYQSVPKRGIVQTTRIGISKSTELPWRYYVRNNIWVSR